MSRPSMLIDLQRCIGCMSCVVACKMENEVPTGISWNKVETVGPVGSFPDSLKMYYLPHACMHCGRALCVEACPTGASYVREDGLVLVDPETCLGCDYCVTACPYAARAIDDRTALAVKCTMCTQLIDEGALPSCVKHCMASARIFGDLEESGNAIEEYLSEGDNQSRLIHLLEDKGTGPTVAYLKPKVGMLTDEVSLALTEGL